MTDRHGDEVSQSQQWDYEHPGDRKADESREAVALDLARAGIYDEAINEAGKMIHYKRSSELIDRLHRERNEVRP